LRTKLRPQQSPRRGGGGLRIRIRAINCSSDAYAVRRRILAPADGLYFAFNGAY
jgi:hypothetical protein